MEKGIVAKANVYRIETNIDLSQVRFNGKDYVNADLEKRIRVTSRNELIVDVLSKYFAEGEAGERQGIIFCVNVMHTNEMARLLNTASISAESYTGQTKNATQVIYPKYHSIMFPDSILTTENKNIITDVSYTNSIHKIYVCTMEQVENLKYGDIVVLYRTAEYGRSAEYSAVVTSICVVESVKKQNEFSCFEDFYEYASKYSVFDKNDLHYWYNRGGCKAIKMTYNAALKRRIVRHDLIEEIGLERNQYWGFFELTNEQFKKIAQKGDIAKILSK